MVLANSKGSDQTVQTSLSPSVYNVFSGLVSQQCFDCKIPF